MSSASSHGRSHRPQWEPPEVAALQALIPGYRIEALLGKGGMGAVYRGRHEALDRPVAIKVLPESLVIGAAGGEGAQDVHQFVERFRREARAMGTLDHPAIVSVYDFGQTSAGHLFIVMEFIDGMDIEEYLRASGGRVAPEHAVAIVSHVLDALDYAHEQGIVHRDIKPANVLINRDGRVKLADFGLAKEFADSTEAGGVQALLSGLTRADVAMGTPDYIAPECLEADGEPDHRVDLYAVGVMLYKLLTGRVPRGVFELPSELNPQLDPEFDRLVAQAMAGRPEDRFQTAAQFRAALGRVSSRPVRRLEPGEESGAVTAAVSRLNFPTAASPADVAVGDDAVGDRGLKRPGAKRRPVVISLVALLVLASVLAAVFHLPKDGDGEGDIAADVDAASQEGRVASEVDTPGTEPAAAVGVPEVADGAATVQSRDLTPLDIDGKTWFCARGETVELQLRASPANDAERAAAWRLVDVLDDCYRFLVATLGRDPAQAFGGVLAIRDFESREAGSEAAAAIAKATGVVPHVDVPAELRLLADNGRVRHALASFAWVFFEDDIGKRLVRPHGNAREAQAIRDVLAVYALAEAEVSGQGSRPKLEDWQRSEGEILRRWSDASGPEVSWAMLVESGPLEIGGMSVGSQAVVRGMLFALCAEHGPDLLRRWLGVAVMRRPIAYSNEAADANFVASLSEAAGKDLAGRFAEEWRWPVASPKTLTTADPAGRVDGLVEGSGWQDLMPRLLDESTSYRRGGWEPMADGKGLLNTEPVLQPVRSSAIVAVETEPLASYDVRCRVQCLEGYGFSIMLPTASGDVALSCTARAERFGLECFRDLHMWRAPRAVLGDGERRKIGEVQEWRVAVRPDSLAVFLDDEPYHRWDGIDWRDYLQGGWPSLRHRSLFGVAAFETVPNSMELLSFEVRVPGVDDTANEAGVSMTDTGSTSPAPLPPDEDDLASALAAIPEARTRLENYRAIREQQLLTLVINFRRFLETQRARQMMDAGHDALVFHDEAIEALKRYHAMLRGALSGDAMAPLPAAGGEAAALLDDMKARHLAFLRQIGERESDLRRQFDGSLAACQQELVAADRVGESETIARYRKRMAGVAVEEDDAEVSSSTPRDMAEEAGVLPAIEPKVSPKLATQFGFSVGKELMLSSVADLGDGNGWTWSERGHWSKAGAAIANRRWSFLSVARSPYPLISSQPYLSCGEGLIEVEGRVAVGADSALVVRVQGTDLRIRGDGLVTLEPVRDEWRQGIAESVQLDHRPTGEALDFQCYGLLVGQQTVQVLVDGEPVGEPVQLKKKVEPGEAKLGIWAADDLALVEVRRFQYWTKNDLLNPDR